MLTKRSNGIPAYRRIQGTIRSVIEAGELKPGDPVASERELARLHEVSLMTARHALASLEREGFAGGGTKAFELEDAALGRERQASGRLFFIVHNF